MVGVLAPPALHYSRDAPPSIAEFLTVESLEQSKGRAVLLVEHAGSGYPAVLKSYHLKEMDASEVYSVHRQVHIVSRMWHPKMSNMLLAWVSAARPNAAENATHRSTAARMSE